MADSLFALALLAVAAWLAFAPAARPRLVVIGVEGLSWPEVAPALQRDAPELARLAAAQRAELTGSAGAPLRFLWDWATTARPLIPRPGSAPRPPLAIWDVAARHGLRALVVSWPGKPGVAAHPSAGELGPVVPRPLAPPLADPWQARLAADRGAAEIAVRLAKQVAPDLLFVGFQGPASPTGPDGPALAPAPPAGYWSALDEALGRVSAALGPGATIVVIGRGSGRSGTPAADGVWIASGAGLAVGPRPGPIRHLEVAPTLLELAGLPLPVGALGRPSSWVRAAPTAPDWRELP